MAPQPSPGPARRPNATPDARSQPADQHRPFHDRPRSSAVPAPSPMAPNTYSLSTATSGSRGTGRGDDARSDGGHRQHPVAIRSRPVLSIGLLGFGLRARSRPAGRGAGPRLPETLDALRRHLHRWHWHDFTRLRRSRDVALVPSPVGDSSRSVARRSRCCQRRTPCGVRVCARDAGSDRWLVSSRRTGRIPISGNGWRDGGREVVIGKAFGDDERDLAGEPPSLPDLIGASWRSGGACRRPHHACEPREGGGDGGGGCIGESASDRAASRGQSMDMRPRQRARHSYRVRGFSAGCSGVGVAGWRRWPAAVEMRETGWSTEGAAHLGRETPFGLRSVRTAVARSRACAWRVNIAYALQRPPARPRARRAARAVAPTPTLRCQFHARHGSLDRGRLRKRHTTSKPRSA